MAKYYNNKVKTGRVAGSVFAIRNGVTIERAYQPKVMDPKSVAQSEVRARFKLVQQISTVLGPVIPMRREGLVSPRNQFIRVNFGKTNYQGGAATIEMLSLDLTNSPVALSSVSASRVAEGTGVNVSLVVGDSTLSRVVYIAVVRQPTDGQIRVVGSVVSSTPGVDFSFTTVIPTSAIGPTTPVYVYAYGVRDNNSATREFFSNLTVDAEHIAKILVTRSSYEFDVTITETRAVLISSTQ